MADFRARTRAVWGEAADRLADAHIWIAGMGGVGCMAAECLARAGVEHFTLVDMDIYEETNINRQLFATVNTLGHPKVEVAAERLRAINPACQIRTVAERISPDNIPQLLVPAPDIVIDAIDTVTAKIALAVHCSGQKTAIISCLGTGNRSDPTRITTGDIADTAGCGCPLARTMRSELRKRKIERLPVVYSTEQPIKALASDSPEGRHSPGSTPMVPNAAGLALGYLAVKHLTGKSI